MKLHMVTINGRTEFLWFPVGTTTLDWETVARIWKITTGMAVRIGR